VIHDGEERALSDECQGLLGGLSRARRAVSLLLLVAVCPLCVQCYGSFPLTQAVYKVNKGVPTGILKTVVFWLFIIAPVYSGAMLVDALVLNLIEFWTGGAVTLGEASDEQGNTFRLAATEDERTAVLTMVRDGEVVGQLRFVRVSDELCEARDAEGRLVGMAVRTPTGDIHLTDADGGVISTIRAEQLQDLPGA
jgi:hypothetical protein